MFIYRSSKNNYSFLVTEQNSLRHTIVLASSEEGMTIIGILPQEKPNNPLK